MRMQPRRKGISLIETLFVISILTILISLLASGVSAIRASMTKIECANNLRQIGLAAHAYHGVHESFPETVTGYILGGFPGPPKAQDYKPRLTWTVRLLPYLEQEALWSLTLEAYKTEMTGLGNPPHTGLVTVVKPYTCPADGRLSRPIADDQGFTGAYGSYWGVASGGNMAESPDPGKLQGAMRREQGVALKEILDGAGNTLYIGEKPPRGRLLSGNWYTIWVDPRMRQAPGYWYFAPGGISAMAMQGPSDNNGTIGYGPGRLDNPYDQLHFWSLHKGGANFLFADGAVRFIPYQARDIMPALATIAGGESVELPH